MDIHIFQEQRKEEMNEVVGIINPSSKDFSCTYDSNEDGKPITYTIKSLEGIMLKRYIADHVSMKLCTQMLSGHKSPVSDELFEKTLKSIRLYE